MQQHHRILARLGPIALAAVGWYAGAAHAVPHRKLATPEVPQLPPAIPKLVQNTNWGTLLQDGRQFVITNPAWIGIGVIHENGKVSLVWTRLETGEPCPAWYEILPNGEMRGVWGFPADVQVGDDGTLTGAILMDHIRSVEREPSGIR